MVGRRSPGPGLQRIHFCGSERRAVLNLCAVDFCGFDPAWACLRHATDAAAGRGIPPMQTQHTSVQTRIRAHGTGPAVLHDNSVIGLYVTLIPNRRYGLRSPAVYTGRSIMTPGPVNSIIEPPGPPDGEPASLAEISAAGIPISWYEGLAVVQQMCRALIDQPGHPAVEVASVFVQPDGTITIQGTESGTADSTVQSLGALLRTWIEGTACPIPLGLVVAQATGTPPFYSSVAQLSEALSHYERSNARELTRGVYETWRGATTPAQDAPTIARLPSGFEALAAGSRAFAKSAGSKGLAMLREARKRSRARPAPAGDIEPKRVRPRVPWLRLATGVIASALVGLAVRELIARRPGPSAARAVDAVSAKAGRVNNRIVDALTPIVGRGLDWLGIHLREATVPSPGGEAVPAPVKRARTRAPAQKAPADTPPVPPADASVPDVNQAQPPEPVDTTVVVAGPAAFDPSVVYSAADQDVTPPVAIDQELRDAPFPGEENVAAIDIVVDETGRVESVSLVTKSGSLQTAMLGTVNLSVAKTWRFNPAVKAGRPVKYRRTVWVSTR